ncbi:CHC2 zinc finger domain-containing protein [Clostridium tyrobutyricum]|uniref:CHC2 zinc finger domain-containing protein n=1 Tax=Clostridium tyrobutyricum TaxID=1519 RepID=UPI001C38A704|nr:CHC2 zinc finger domain-containing protein [Clostridium tyrobutyricum]MBV4439326.1 DNA primase [Clostridium tyrobutyricum]
MEVSDIKLKELIEQETGEKFNRENKICCPFHEEKTPSFSVRFNPNTGKDQFKCFSCGENGDSLDFIMKLKNMKYNEAREYLGLTVEKSVQEQQIEKLKECIEWQIKKFKWKDTLIGLFPFMNDKGEIAYFKAKFKNDKGEKRLSYYHIENDKVINKRGSEELPYNLYNAIEGIKNGKILIICEGEKDSNLLNNIFSNNKYVATSVKNVKDLSILSDANIYICGDTGGPGQKYIEHIKSELFQYSNMFKIINLPGIEELGDNKDVGDWLEAGHSKKDLLQAFNRSLDLKNKYELQQDCFGIYKTIFSEDDEKKKYIANFNIETAYNIKFIDENSEGIKLVLKSPLRNIIERVDKVNVFDDLKSFRNFLGSMDLVFTGTTNDLMALKVWIRKYFALTDKEIYTGTSFLFNKSGKLSLITQQGSIISQKYNSNILSDGGANIDVLNIKPINKTELKELMIHLFEFTTYQNSYSLIGTTINNLAIAQAIKVNIKFHILLLAGESGAGKSTVTECVIMPLLNLKDDPKSIGLITKFALIKALSDGNYSVIFEEHKPSGWDERRISMISEILRNLYDKHTIDRGSKDLKNNKVFQPKRPTIIVGEERYSNIEKALMDRSCIIYLSKAEITENQTASMEWIKSHQDILNKLGRSLVDMVLNMSVDEYRELREYEASKIEGLKDRPLNTAINICTGIAILNKLLNKFDLQNIENYRSIVAGNIKNEILNDMNDSLSEVEKILKLYDQIIGDERVKQEEIDKAIQIKNGKIYIRTSEMFNQIRKYMKDIGEKKPMMEIGDFKKQAQKSGYLLKLSLKQIKVNKENTRFDLYNSNRLKRLKVDSIVPPDYEETEWESGEQQVIYPDKFNKKGS